MELSPHPLDGSSPEAAFQDSPRKAGSMLRNRLTSPTWSRFQKLQGVATLRRNLRDQIVIAS